MNLRTLNFEKDPDGRWYAVLPDYPGPRADCEMVMGADTLLEILSQGEGRATINVLTDGDGSEAKGGTVLSLIGEGGLEGGGYYHLSNHMGVPYDLTIWLCSVTEYVFGYLPITLTFYVL